LFADIRELLISGYDADSHLITHTATLGGDLGLDSIDIVDFIMDLEDAYDIQITDREFDGAKTLGDLAALLEKKGCTPVFFVPKTPLRMVGEAAGTDAADAETVQAGSAPETGEAPAGKTNAPQENAAPKPKMSRRKRRQKKGSQDTASSGQ
jgi:acyl carrier protein